MQLEIRNHIHTSCNLHAVCDKIILPNNVKLDCCMNVQIQDQTVLL